MGVYNKYKAILYIGLYNHLTKVFLAQSYDYPIRLKVLYACISTKRNNLAAEGFDPSTSGLWAPRASPALRCFNLRLWFQKKVELFTIADLAWEFNN